MFKNILHISCRKASYLVSKKEDGQTSRLENIQLHIHKKICTGCTLFARQSAFIARQAATSTGYSDKMLSAETKTKLRSMIANLNNG